MTRLGLAAVADILQLWLTMGIAAVALWPIYQSSAFVLLAAVAIAVGTLVALVGAVFRWPAWGVLFVTFAVYLVIGVPLAVPSKAVAGVLPSLEGVVDLIAGIALGWKQLLTITLPVGDYQALLVPALVLLLGGTVLAGSIALRARYGEYATLGPVAVFIAAIAFGPAEAQRPVLLGLAMLVASVGWVSTFRWRRRRALAARYSRDRESTLRRVATDLRALVGGVAIIAVASAGSVAAASSLAPSNDREVLRTVIAQPFDPRDYASPLSGFRAYLQEEAIDRDIMRVEGLPSGSRIRLATLDTYDGVVYAVGSATVDSASGTFVRLPSRIDRSDIAGERASIDVEITGYSGVWVPTVGLLEHIEFRGDRAQALVDGFAINAASGTAADVRGLRSGDRYRLETVVPDEPELPALRDAVPGSRVVPRLAQAPEELVEALDGYVEGIDGSGARLVAAIDGLRAEGFISHGIDPDEPASRSGHSLDRITELFAAPRMIGDAEQYAVAAALMADRLGFPARVVLGFAPEPAGEAKTLVRGSDITAWIEVDTAEYGWVTIDPVPPVRPIPDEEPEEPTPVSRPESIVPPPADRPDPREEQTDPETTAEEPVVPDATWAVLLQVLRIVGAVLLVALLIASPFLLVVAAKLRRRYLRSHAPTALARIRGGWDEFADAVADRGLPLPAAATRSELASVVGTLPSRVLAAVVDRAVFAPDEPADADADRVWTAVGELRASLDAHRSRRDRLRALVSVRSLGGGTVRQLFQRSGGRG